MVPTFTLTSAQLRYWARNTHIPKGLRVLYAIMALLAERGGDAVMSRYDELGHMIGLNSDGASKAIRWLTQRSMLTSEKTGHNLILRIRPEAEWHMGDADQEEPARGGRKTPPLLDTLDSPGSGMPPNVASFSTSPLMAEAQANQTLAQNPISSNPGEDHAGSGEKISHTWRESTPHMAEKPATHGVTPEKPAGSGEKISHSWRGTALISPRVAEKPAGSGGLENPLPPSPSPLVPPAPPYNPPTTPPEPRIPASPGAASSAQTEEATESPAVAPKRKPPAKRKPSAQRPGADPITKQVGEVLATLRVLLTRRAGGWREIDATHMGHIRKAIADGMPPTELEDALARFIGSRTTTGDLAASLDEVWLVPTAIKQWEAQKAAREAEASASSRAVAARAESGVAPRQTTRRGVVICDYCMAALGTPNDEADGLAKLRQHYEETHPGREVPAQARIV